MIAKHFFFFYFTKLRPEEMKLFSSAWHGTKTIFGLGSKTASRWVYQQIPEDMLPTAQQKKKRKLAKSWLPKFKYADCCSTLKTECKQGHNIFGNAHYQYLLSVTLLKMFVCGCRLPERFLANVLWLAPTFFFVYAIVCTSTSVLSVSLPSVQWASKVPQWHLY